jgi:hypothetical protein
VKTSLVKGKNVTDVLVNRSQGRLLPCSNETEHRSGDVSGGLVT